MKTVDETLSASTTLQNDDALIIPITANAVLFFLIMLQVGAPNTVMDFKYGFTYPSGCTIRHGQFAAGSGAYGPYTPTGTPAAPNDENSVIGFDLAAANYNPIHATGIIYGGGTSGFVQLQWAQRTSDAGTLTVRKGSVFLATGTP